MNHIDHIDGNGMNNRIENLRECSPIENGQNRRALNKNNTSGYAGVWKHKSGWAAEVMFEYTKYDLGVYPTIDAANKAREAAKQKLHTFNPMAPTSKYYDITK